MYKKYLVKTKSSTFELALVVLKITRFNLPLSPTPHTHTHLKSIKHDESFLSLLTFPTQYDKFIYCFQLQLDFSFNLTLTRKHLIHFPAFLSHRFKLWIRWRIIFCNAIYKLFCTLALNLSFLNLHLCSLNECFQWMFFN